MTHIAEIKALEFLGREIPVLKTIEIDNPLDDTRIFEVFFKTGSVLTDGFEYAEFG